MNTHHVCAVVTDLTLPGSRPTVVEYDVGDWNEAIAMVADEYSAANRGGIVMETDDLELRAMTIMKINR